MGSVILTRVSPGLYISAYGQSKSRIEQLCNKYYGCLEQNKSVMTGWCGIAWKPEGFLICPHFSLPGGLWF